jgi:hypothetical protein
VAVVRRGVARVAVVRSRHRRAIRCNVVIAAGLEARKRGIGVTEESEHVVEGSVLKHEHDDVLDPRLAALGACCPEFLHPRISGSGLR